MKLATMRPFKMIVLFICFGVAATVDIFVKVRFRSSAVMTSYSDEETITAKNEQELKEKLTEKLENALLDKQIEEVTIETDIYHGNKVHSTQITKFDVTTLHGLDDTTLVTTIKGDDITKAVTSSAARSSHRTKEVGDVTTSKVLENVFTTRSITSVASTRSFQESTLTVMPEICGFIYNSACFRAIVYNTKNVTLSDAESICRNKLANIYNLEHYSLLQEYLRSLIPDGWTYKWVLVWTGMTYEGNQLKTTTGEVVQLPDEEWYPKFPKSDVWGTTIIVEVDKNQEKYYQGLKNTNSDRHYHGAICEIYS